MSKVTDKSCFHNGENSNTSFFIIDVHQRARKLEQFKKFKLMSYKEQVILFITVNSLVPFFFFFQVMANRLAWLF